MFISIILSELGLTPSYYALIVSIVTYEVVPLAYLVGFDLPKRELFWLRVIGTFVVSFGISSFLGWLRTLNNSFWMQTFCTLFLYCWILAILYICFKLKFNSLLLYWCEVLAIREMVDVIYTIFLYLLFQDVSTLLINGNNFLSAFLYDLFHYFFQAGLFFIFHKKGQAEKDEQARNEIIWLSLIIILIVVIAKTLLIYTKNNEDLRAYIIADFISSILCLIVLLMRSSIIQSSEYRKEIYVMNQVLDAEKKQYESIKENIDIINMKCHDIKHQLEFYQDKLAYEDVEKLKTAITIYDQRFNTGNTVLDTVLYERSLRCDKFGIVITCIANPDALKFMSTSHLYYLFSNILDNAIEATKDLHDKDKKIIGLNVILDSDVCVIDSYNYFDGSLNVKDSKIQTKKEDKLQHGFGLKSIKFVAEEYGGTMDVNVEEDMFFLNVKMPINNKVSSNQS